MATRGGFYDRRLIAAMGVASHSRCKKAAYIPRTRDGEKQAMRNRRSFVFIPLALAMLGLASQPVMADSQTHTYQFHLEAPNVARAPNGDMVSVTGMGTFSVNQKSATGSGSFTHTNSQGTILGSGTWTATELLSFQSYGCGVVLGTTIPD